MDIQRPKSKQPIPEHAKCVFKGILFDVYQWEQELYDGTRTIFEKLKRPDTVVVFPVLPDGKIISLGGKKLEENRLIVDWYRKKEIKKGKDPWFLRIRTYSDGKHEVTWKSISNILGKARKHKEINFFIEEPKKLSDLFEEVGLEKYAHQEKDRESFSLKDWRFDIDQYPNMPAFLEIEGKSENHIKKALQLLNLENNRTWADGERTLIEKIYKLNWYNMKF